MAAQILVNISSGKGLALARCQANTWNNADLLSIKHQNIYFNEIFFETQIFLLRVNAFENVVSKMSAILFMA